MSRHHETKTAIIQNLAIRNINVITPSSFVTVCSALVAGGYTVAEIMKAFDSLVRERVVEYLPGDQRRGFGKSIH